jgi:hypothetical protein
MRAVSLLDLRTEYSEDYGVTSLLADCIYSKVRCVSGEL